MKRINYKDSSFIGFKCYGGRVEVEGCKGDKSARFCVRDLYNENDMKVSISSVNGDDGVFATYELLKAFYEGLDQLRKEFEELKK